MIFLQETHSQEGSEIQWKNEWGAKIFYSHGSPNSCGVMVLIRNKLNCTVKKTVSDPSGRNIWSSRGLYVYGKVTIIKSLLIPKLVYVSSLLPTLLKIIKQVNHIIFTFLRKGKDKVTRFSAINTLEEGGIKMIDIEIMIKALRLAWSKRIFNNNDSTWKFYLIYVLKKLEYLLIS